MKATQLDQMKVDFIHIKTTRYITEEKVAQHSQVRISPIVTFIFILFQFIVEGICNPIRPSPLALLEGLVSAIWPCVCPCAVLKTLEA